LINRNLFFAGYGIAAPEYNRDDFQGMDLEGKFVNDLGYGTSEVYFKGKHSEIKRRLPTFVLIAYSKNGTYGRKNIRRRLSGKTSADG
jgi:hypothetical protein